MVKFQYTVPKNYVVKSEKTQQACDQIGWRFMGKQRVPQEFRNLDNTDGRTAPLKIKEVTYSGP